MLNISCPNCGESGSALGLHCRNCGTYLGTKGHADARETKSEKKPDIKTMKDKFLGKNSKEAEAD